MVHMLCDRSLGASASSYCFFFFFCLKACGVLAPQPGIEPEPQQ